jgi:repressor LexA
MNTNSTLLQGRSLTGKQEKFYNVLSDYIEKKGMAPTVEELMKSLNLSSPRAVGQYLETLERKGLILRSRYQKRGIRLANENSSTAETVTIPVIASAGCDNLMTLAERTFDDYICVSSDMLQGKEKKNIVCIKAVGDSMKDAGIYEGDYVLVEVTENIFENDLVVAIIDNFAVIKKLELANNAIILRPVSSEPEYKPIIVRRDFHFFGKVIDVIRFPQKGDIEVVPLYPVA